MPRPMIRQNQTQTQVNSILDATQNCRQAQRQTQQMDKMKMDRLLRKKRSKEYMDAMHALDAGGHVHNQDKVDSIIEAIRAEFPELEINGILLGIVSRCGLGKPYEVHTLDMAGQIIIHYVRGEELPSGLEKARAIAMRGGYDFIEVYVDCCRAVSRDGSISVIV